MTVKKKKAPPTTNPSIQKKNIKRPVAKTVGKVTGKLSKKKQSVPKSIKLKQSDLSKAVLEEQIKNPNSQVNKTDDKNTGKLSKKKESVAKAANMKKNNLSRKVSGKDEKKQSVAKPKITNLSKDVPEEQMKNTNSQATETPGKETEELPKKEESVAKSVEIKKSNFSSNLLMNMIVEQLSPATKSAGKVKELPKKKESVSKSVDPKKSHLSRDLLKNMKEEQLKKPKRPASESARKEMGKFAKNKESVTKSVDKKESHLSSDMLKDVIKEQLKNTKSPVTASAGKVTEASKKKEAKSGEKIGSLSKDFLKELLEKEERLEAKKSSVEKSPSVKRAANEEKSINKKKKKLQSSKNAVADEDSESCSVLVTNIELNKRTSLLKFFGQYGKVKSVKLRIVNESKKKRNKQDDNMAYSALVHFMNSESAKKALEANGKVFQGKNIQVQLYSEKSTFSEACSVFIRNIRKSVKKEDIQNKFETCGEIDSLRVRRDGESKNTVSALVNFKTPEAAKSALEMNGSMFLERKIIIKSYKAEDTNANKKKKKTEKKKLKEKKKTASNISNEATSNQWKQPAVKSWGTEGQNSNASEGKHLVFDDSENGTQSYSNNRMSGHEKSWNGVNQRSSGHFRNFSAGAGYGEHNRMSVDIAGQNSNQRKHVVFDDDGAAASNGNTFGKENTWNDGDKWSSGDFREQNRGKSWDHSNANQGNQMNIQQPFMAKPKSHIIFD